MKKTFLVKRNALFSSTNISWGAYALLFSVLILLLRLVAPNFFWIAFTPVMRVSDAFANAGHSFFSSFEDRAKLSLQNEKLLEENNMLTNENQTLAQKIRGLSSLPRDANVVAGVIARPPSSPYDTLVLAGGLNEGITLGMEAFVPLAGKAGAVGVPIGIVSDVLADVSRVTLFSAPGVTTNGWVGEKNVPIIIAGAGAGSLRTSVARSAGIGVGDTVSVPGPGHLAIGSVTRVDSDPNSPSVTLQIRPAFNLFMVGWVVLRDTGMTALKISTSTPI